MVIRYVVQFMYNKYQILDMHTEHLICFTYMSEDAQTIADAMNKINIEEA